jgi:exodeoxyribonuclease VII small subunit
MSQKKTEKLKEEEKNPSIEENFAQLEDIIRKLETGDRSLEETFAGYEQGMQLVKELNGQIDKVEKQIQILSEGDENE